MSVAGFIGDQRTEHGVPHAVTCWALEVSESWFYKWRRRPQEPTKREVRRTVLAERIKVLFENSKRCGSPISDTARSRRSPLVGKPLPDGDTSFHAIAVGEVSFDRGAGVAAMGTHVPV